MKFLESVIGTWLARQSHAKEEQDRSDLVQKYKFLCQARDELGLKDEFEEEHPIFILSAGWRSGSTLLQRIICSSNGVLIWGEPYDKSNIITNLSKMMLPIQSHWPLEEYYGDSLDLADVKNTWVANLYPSLSDFFRSHQAFLRTLFVEPAHKNSFDRWGVKEVRFGLQEAVYLKIMFPKSHLLFLDRDLFAAYSSYKNFCTEMNWYSEWPDKTAFTPYAFAKHRARLKKEFKVAKDLLGGIEINYDEMVKGSRKIKEINQYCSLSMDENVLENRVGSGDKQSRTKRQVDFVERLLLRIGDSSNSHWI